MPRVKTSAWLHIANQQTVTPRPAPPHTVPYSSIRDVVGILSCRSAPPEGNPKASRRRQTKDYVFKPFSWNSLTPSAQALEVANSKLLLAPVDLMVGRLPHSRACMLCQ